MRGKADRLDLAGKFFVRDPFSKKGSSEMWWIIIGAVIALVVLIILIVMFTGKTNKLEGGLSGCESKGGICVVDTNDGCPGMTLQTSAFECPTDYPLCCLGSPKDTTTGCTDTISGSRKDWCK